MFDRLFVGAADTAVVEGLEGTEPVVVGIGAALAWMRDCMASICICNSYKERKGKFFEENKLSEQRE